MSRNTMPAAGLTGVYAFWYRIYETRMALSIRSPKAQELARRVARLTGRTMTDAIIDALEEKVARIETDPLVAARLERVMSISRRCATLPTLDSRPEEEILGYED